MAVAGDVPGTFDVVLNGKGYVFLDAIEPSLPFRNHRATYSLSPTFIDRSNVTGAFGDNQQDWWLTASQNDWSLGEEQKFFRQTDATSRSRYWRGMNTDLTVPGQMMIGRNTGNTTFASPASSIVSHFGNGVFYVTGTTDLFEVNAAGDTVTNRGAHGAGGTPTALAADGFSVYISGVACTSVRKWNGSAFSTFSTSNASSLAYANNTLYGYCPGVAGFARWDSAGVPSALFVWKGADGVQLGLDTPVIAYGPRIVIIRNQRSANGTELWIYDGNGVSKLQDFEPNFNYHSMCVSEGILFLIGFGQKRGFFRTEVRYYANGTVGVAYTSQWTSSVQSGKMTIAPFGNGVIFSDPVYNAMMYYDLALGGASTFAPFAASSVDSYVTTSNTAALMVNSGTTGKRYFASESASAASLQTSLFDFDSSLTKVLRAVKLDFDSATDGDGGSVDLYYALNDLTASFTSLGTGVTAGSEVSFANSTTCRSVSFLIVLNKGTSTSGPVLKRLYVRAAPLLQQFKKREYILDCSGDGALMVRELRDGTPDPRSGREQVNDLVSLAQSSVPFTITDRFSSFTGLVDLDDQEGFEIHETHAAIDNPSQSGNFVVRVRVREV